MNSISLPVYSIITINLNNYLGLTKTLSSVFSQKNKSYEIIVVDGLSCDGSIEYLKSQEHKLNKLIIEGDTGVYNAMNKALKYASGEYLLFLNSGDVLYNSDVLHNIIQFLNVDVLYAKAVRSDMEGVFPKFKEINIKNLILNNVMHQASFYRREIHGFFDEKFTISADRKKNIELIHGKHSFNYIDLITTIYEGNGISTKLSSIDSFLIRNEIFNEVFSNDFAEIVTQWVAFRKLNHIYKGKFGIAFFNIWLIFSRLFGVINKEKQNFYRVVFKKLF